MIAGDFTNIDEYLAERYCLRRGLFHWVVASWDILDYEVGYGWRAHKRFLHKNNAVAYLVALKLQGHKVEL
jgi:hypothetical protein